MKKSIVLFELLISIVLVSIISIYTLNFSFNIFEQNSKNHHLNIAKIDLESTKLFLQNKKDSNENIISQLQYTNEELLYNNQLLLKYVTKFEISSSGDLIKIDICLKEKFEICKSWVLY